mgnify:CR=1 FL=1
MMQFITSIILTIFLLIPIFLFNLFLFSSVLVSQGIPEEKAVLFILISSIFCSCLVVKNCFDVNNIS